MHSSLGRNLRDARKARRLTQFQLADLSHVGRATIANVERGTQDVINTDTLMSLAKSLHVSADELLKPRRSSKR